jgi:hypothetical protein
LRHENPPEPIPSGGSRDIKRVRRSLGGGELQDVRKV